MGAFPCFGVVVTAADRAAATFQRRVSYKLGGSGEGFQRAIAKPFGASADAAPRLLPQKQMVEDIGNTAQMSWCGGE